MTLGPRELLEKVVQDERPRIRRAERLIDEALTERYNGLNTVAIDATLFHGIRAPALNKLLDAYRHAGWTVQYQSDQRDGDFYQFSTIERDGRRDHGIYS